MDHAAEAVHRTLEELDATFDHVAAAPRERGVVQHLAVRPDVDRRETREEVELTLEDGVVGDNWRVRGSTRTPDGSARPEMQITIMNARSAEAICGARENWATAGDQFFVDLDLSEANLPPGTRLRLGSALVEVTEVPHTGCAKFSKRFGSAALRFVNSERGRAANLRGVNARVVEPGRVRVGDAISKA
ncbi:MAG: MOSC domain-containing protein [Planctomycetota bacterium]